MSGKAHWIQGAVHPERKGKFKRYEKTHGGVAKGIKAGLKSKSPTLRREAQFAKAMQTIRARHRKGH